MWWRGIVAWAPAWPAGASGAHRIEDDERDLAIGARLVLVVVRPHRSGPGPPFGLLGRRRRVGGVVLELGAVLKADSRVGNEVQVPDGMLGRAPHRRHDRIAIAVPDPHE